MIGLNQFIQILLPGICYLEIDADPIVRFLLASLRNMAMFLQPIDGEI